MLLETESTKVVDPHEASTTLAEGRKEDADSVEELLSQAKEGDHDAFMQLLDQHMDLFRLAAVRVTSNKHDAEDVLQTCILKAWQRLKQDDVRSFKWWMLAVIKNTAIKQMKKKHTSADDVMFLMKSREQNPAEYVARHEKSVEEIRALVTSRLNHLYAESFLLFYFDDFSLKEIASRLAIPVGTIKRRLHVARNRLRETFTHPVHA